MTTIRLKVVYPPNFPGGEPRVLADSTFDIYANTTIFPVVTDDDYVQIWISEVEKRE